MRCSSSVGRSKCHWQRTVGTDEEKHIEFHREDHRTYFRRVLPGDCWWRIYRWNRRYRICLRSCISQRPPWCTRRRISAEFPFHCAFRRRSSDTLNRLIQPCPNASRGQRCSRRYCKQTSSSFLFFARSAIYLIRISFAISVSCSPVVQTKSKLEKTDEWIVFCSKEHWQSWMGSSIGGIRRIVQTRTTTDVQSVIQRRRVMTVDPAPEQLFRVEHAAFIIGRENIACRCTCFERLNLRISRTVSVQIQRFLLTEICRFSGPGMKAITTVFEESPPILSIDACIAFNAAKKKSRTGLPSSSTDHRGLSGRCPMTSIETECANIAYYSIVVITRRFCRHHRLR